MKTTFFAKFLAVVFALTAAPALFAQSTGALAGTVKDQNDAVIPGASVRVINTGTNLTRNTVTNDDGRWSLTNLS